MLHFLMKKKTQGWKCLWFRCDPEVTLIVGSLLTVESPLTAGSPLTEEYTLMVESPMTVESPLDCDLNYDLCGWDLGILMTSFLTVKWLHSIYCTCTTTKFRPTWRCPKCSLLQQEDFMLCCIGLVFKRKVIFKN